METMTKSEFIDRVRRAREAWEAQVVQYDADRMEQPGFTGEWSLKEVIAHIIWYDREMVEMLKNKELAGSPLWELPLDERNAAIYVEIKSQNLGKAQVLDEAQKVYDELLRLLDMCDDQDLNDPKRFAGMPPDWKPWEVIASNTYEHYAEHAG
jgi:hypothetical protein